MTLRKTIFVSALLLMLALRTDAQEASSTDASSSSEASSDQESESERWNLFFQATSIGDYHGTFRSPYEGPLSLQDYPERDVSLTSTLFFTVRLEQNTFLIFDPEIAGGKGFSGVNGIADQPNGEIPRVASATPKPYIARLLIQHDFGFGSDKERQESDENQLAGDRPMTRYSVYAGRFTITDYFDDNNYTHDPRTQFMAWGVMYNGAWDYPADTRGYTWGIVQEFHTRNWAFRYGIVAEPKVANGRSSTGGCSAITARCGKRSGVTRGGNGTARFACWATTIARRPAITREALKLAAATGTTPNVSLTDRVGTLKYGTGISFDQAHYFRRRRLHAPGLERRQDAKLRVYRHRPSGERRRFHQRARAGTGNTTWWRRRSRPAAFPPFIASIWPPADSIF